MEELIGKKIANRYRVEALLGHGGMADVYKVYDERRSVYLAMKVLHDDLAEDKAFIRRFKAEAKTLMDLQHPHIVRFYGMEQDGDLVFMLMEFIDGTTLRKEIKKTDKPLSNQRILQIMRPVCSALTYTHNMGRVHCDVKPANIMFKTNGDVLLTDFGISRISEGATVTMAGAGTPGFMPLEQMMGKDPVPTMDIYALGVTLYEMVTNDRPFTGSTTQISGTVAEKIRAEQMSGKVTPPRKFNRDILPAVEVVVLKCLEKDPQKRFQKVEDLLKALEAAMPEDAKAPIPVPAQGIGAEPPSENFFNKFLGGLKSGKPLSWGIVGGMAIIIVVAIVLSLGSKHPLVSTISSTATSEVIAVALPTETIAPPTPTTDPNFPPPCTSIGQEWTSPKDGMVLVCVPNGAFSMGAGDNINYVMNYNKPIHRVNMSAYWIDKYEVSNAQYGACVSSGACSQPGSDRSAVYSSYFYEPKYQNYPVGSINWNQATAYCEWANRQLPTEARWEKAARGDDERLFPWGNNEATCEYANYASCKGGDAVAVDSYSQGKSPYGVYNMAGNVEEWVSDWFEQFYYKDSSNSTDPTGEPTGSLHILRGGGFLMKAEHAYTFSRELQTAGFSDWFTGFRCAMSSPK